jgi:predicted Zn-dependent protease with MMP-like domain
VTFDWKFLLTAAREEVAEVIASLPAELESVVKNLPITYDPRNNGDLRALDLHDTLGLFVGKSLLATDEQAEDVPAQVILFLVNIWAFAEADEATYRLEVRTTFLHELGHFLGLEENDLEERGL